MGHIFNDAVTFNGAASFNGSTSGVTASTANNTELNVIGNPINATNWAVTNTAGSNPMAVVTTTTAGDLPLSGSISSAIKFTSRTVAGAEASEYVAYSFTTPASLSGKMKIEFYMRPGSNFVTNEWTVSVYQSTTRQALSTDSSGATTLPNAAGKFTTTVDLLASTAYTLRFARPTNAGANAAVLNVTNVIVGPGVQPQGAVIGKEISYTPTIGNVTTSTATARYVQIGTNARITAFFTTSAAATGVMTVSLPTGLTIDTTALPSSTQGEQAVGSYRGIKASGSPFNDTGTVIYYTTTTVAMQSKDRGTPNDSDDPWASASGDKFSLTFTVPIAEWAGSGTVNVAQNDVEFAYNTSTSTSTDTTSFGYGPQGALIQNFAPAGTASVNKRIQWQRPQQAGDEIVLEVDVGSGGAYWIDIKTRFAGFSSNDAGTTNYGAIVLPQSATQADVSFYSAGYPGVNWSAINTWRWRVRKSSAGAAVGFGIATPTSSGLVPSGTYDPSTSSWTFGTGISNSVTIANNGFITSSTSDGSDNRSLTISGGGGGTAWNQNRGAGIVLQGNEVSGGEGELVYYAGNSGGTFGRHTWFAGGVNVGICSRLGAWTFGSSSSTTGPHFFNVNANGDYIGVFRNYNTTQPLGLQILYPSLTPNDTGKEFIVCQDSTAARFTVRSNGGIANFQANNVNLSDERLKTSIRPTSNKLEFICSLQVKDFEYKDKPGVINTGLIAQEVEVLDPLLVQETGNIQVVDGEEVNPKAVRTTEIYHMMIKAIQELKAELDAAKAEIAVLKSGSLG